MFMYGQDFEEKGHAAQWAKKRGLSKNIHFCGSTPHHDLQRMLKRMSVLLHPALEESFGMAVVEAMALGLPVVAGIGSGAVPWVLDDGHAGFLTDVRNPKKIAETLLTCIEQKQPREQRRRNAYKRVISLFSPSSVAEQSETIYERVLSLY